MKIYELHQDVSGRWFGYCEETKEYTPSFIKCKNLKKMLIWKARGWKCLNLETVLWELKMKKNMKK